MFLLRLLPAKYRPNIKAGSMTYLKRLLSYVRPQWHRMAVGVLFGMAAAASNAVMLIGFQVIFSIVLKGGAISKSMVRNLPFVGQVDLAKVFHLENDAKASLGVVVGACACIPLLIFIRGFLGYLSTRTYVTASMRILYQIRHDLYQAILRQSLSFFNRSKGGQLMQVVSLQATMLQTNALALVQALTRHPLTILSILFVLFSMDWLFTLLSLLVFPLCIIPVRIIAKKAQRSGQIETQASSDMLVCMHEALGGIRVVKGNSREDYELDRFNKANTAMTADAIRFNRMSDLSGTLVETVASLGIAAGMICWWMQGKSADQFLLLVMALLQMYPPVKELSRLGLTLERTIVATESVFELLDRVPEVKDAPQATALRPSGGNVVFKDVTFAYADETGNKIQRKAVHGINLSLEPGKFYALVGPTGAGKSTLFSLMLRFYDVDEGSIEVDGRDIRNVSQRSLRENFGVVSQDVFLFHDTIRENIRYGRLDATDEEIMVAARKAHVEEFVRLMPGGYNTVVGDSGVNLSGGQKQRISIARSILRNAPILLLDEATSALDTESERIIQEAIHDLAEGRTVVAIAHRLSTVLAADQIIVMQNGHVEAAGPHQELMRISPLYQKLYNLQFHSHPDDEGGTESAPM
ncbi:MAG: ABC transporter ATP-binding protein [Verrucomicrobiaceae bacterium]